MAYKVVYIVSDSNNKSVTFSNMSKVQSYLMQRLPFDHVLTIERKAFMI